MKKPLIFLLFLTSFFIGFSQGTWKRIDSLNGGSVGFGIGNNAFVCFVGDSANQLWQLNSSNQKWERKQDFPAKNFRFPKPFIIQDKAFIFGVDYNSNPIEANLWEYNSIEDTWIKKNNFPGGFRNGAIAFSVNGKGYLGLGLGDEIKKDIWEYTPETDQWVKKSDFPSPRWEASATSNEKEAFVGLGSGVDTMYTDFWQYDSGKDKWIKRKDFPSGEGGNYRRNAIAFMLGCDAFMGFGNTCWLCNVSDLFKFDYNSGVWNKIDSLPITDFRNLGVGFSTKNKAYIGLGGTLGKYTFSPTNEIFEYSPLKINTNVSPLPSENQFEVICNINKVIISHNNEQPYQVQIFNILGELIAIYYDRTNTTEICLNKKGFCLIKITCGKNEILKKLIIQ